MSHALRPLRSFVCRSAAAFTAVLLWSASALAQEPFPFQNEKLGAEDRITDLLHRMTLQEKVEAFGTDPTVPRLGVVGTSHVEGLHGLASAAPAHGKAGTSR